MNNTLTTELVAELRRLMAEATPGPWSIGLNGEVYRRIDGSCTDADIIAQFYDNPGEEEGVANGDLCISAVNALPALLDAAEREAKMREALREILTECEADSRIMRYLHYSHRNKARAALAEGGAA
jgi:hypothetical protein